MHTQNDPRKMLILVAGAKGAIGSTLCVAAAVLQKTPEAILNYLTTQQEDLKSYMADDFAVAGWDLSPGRLEDAVKRHAVLPGHLWQPCADNIQQIQVAPAPPATMPLQAQVTQLMADIAAFRRKHDGAQPVLVNLLPAGKIHDLAAADTLESLYRRPHADILPDMAYVLAAVMSGVPVVNFTPNSVEIPVVQRLAEENGVPMAGKDGKTGQTYLKVVLASALRARHLNVNGWYSLNILGNADGQNLMNPENAAGKLENKTDILDDILGYTAGAQYDGPAHKVHIDYYPPRGDAKEAWDVIDFEGLMGMPMSLRLNLLGRDSILAAPMVLDLARWMGALQNIGRRGLVPELAFYFKKAAGANGIFSFQAQMAAIDELTAAVCNFHKERR